MIKLAKYSIIKACAMNLIITAHYRMKIEKALYQTNNLQINLYSIDLVKLNYKIDN